MGWYQQTVEELYDALETSEQGLSASEASVRLKKYGPNQLAVKKEPLWKIIFEPFKSIFVVVLLVAAAVSLLSHELLEAVVVMVIILIDAVIFYTQQYATSRVLRNLRKHNLQSVIVTRDGKQVIIESAKLVPGDILHLVEGERISADARVTSIDGLQVDESTLTGESVPVHKHTSRLEVDKPIYEQANMVFQGTYVLAGTAKVLVVEIGGRTEFGKIAQLATGEASKSPVQKKIDALISTMIKGVGILVVIVFILSLARGIPANDALRFVLSLSVSAVPEGLPVALTVIIVLGMRRMAKHNVLVRSFKAIEDIGLVTTIATDKTGTLTKNHLTVVDSWKSGDEAVSLAALHTLNSSERLSDPLDIAIEEKAGGNHGAKVDKVYPFNLSIRMSGAYIEKDKTIYIKGSPEHMLAKSSVVGAQHRKAESVMRELASNGYRVIGVGKVKINGVPPKDLTKLAKGDIQLIGFLAFADELRPEAPSAIRKAREAGISVRLITGDHYETAYNIGKKLGLASKISQVTRGEDLPKDKHALALAIQNKTIFARILPADKFGILQALKETEITAMTGDGVNDVPALANAHVGIAMGSGSDIARDAGGMVLLNDNFASIIEAISEGRKIFDNIRRMLFYLLSTSLGEILTMVGALLVGLPLPVTAIQILWINLMTDTAMVLPLGMEPAEEGHMKRPPRRPDDPLLSRVLMTRMVITGVTMAVATLITVYVLVQQGQSLAYIQTVAMTVLVVTQWANAFNARSEMKSSFSRIKHANNGLIVGFIIAIISQYMVIYGPLAAMFGVEAVPLDVILVTSGLGAVVVVVVSEVHKWFVKKLLLKSS